MHQSERAFRAHAKGQQVRRRAGLTGSCCRGAGHDEGRKRVRKGFLGRNSLRPLFAFSVWAVLHSGCGRYCKAYKIACDRGVRKYFEHAGALITADGTGDELIKLEGMPKNYKFTF